ncbi:hypothetical protein IJ182_08490 [bacterium]|nr:hypothetical protein [bacterium]
MINIFDKISGFFKKNQKVFFIISMLFFVTVTIIGVIVHEPWYDEAQSWLIAQDLNFFEILKQMRYEGHLFLWYLLLMPLAKLNCPYPISMQIVNLLFIWFAVYVMWKKLPLNPFFKVLITFSAPICYQYAVVARCYSIGIFLLFLLTAYYKEKLNKPYLYSALIFLCANTSSLALIGATAFGIAFFVEYIRNNKTFFKTKEFWNLAAIAFITIFSILYQWHGTLSYLPVLDNLEGRNTSVIVVFWAIVEGLFNIEDKEAFDIPLLIGSLYIILSILGYKKSKNSLFIFLFTFFGLFVLFIFLYNGSIFHHHFYYIYFIISVCIYNLYQEKKDVFYYLLITFFIVVSAQLVYVNFDFYYNEDINYDFSNDKKVMEIIEQDENLRNSDIFVCDMFSLSVIPYLKAKGIDVKTCYNDKNKFFWDHATRESYGLDEGILLKEELQKYLRKKVYLISSYLYCRDIPNEYQDTYKIETYKNIDRGYEQPTSTVIWELTPIDK